MSYTLGQQISETELFPSGIAFVIIPSGIDRDKYISDCYKTTTVSIYSPHNGYSNKVLIDKHSLNFIDFPEKTNQFGSSVSFIIDPVNKKPIVTGIYFNTEEICDLSEKQFKFKRQTNERNFVEITGSAKEKYISLNVNSEDGGEIFLNIRNQNGGGKLHLQIEGDTIVENTGNTYFSQYDRFTSITKNIENESVFSIIEQSDEEVNIKADKTALDTSNFTLNNGSEPFLLGNKFAAFMKDLIKEIGSSTVTTALGQMPLLNATQILEYQNKVDELLSTVAFLDE